jgi:diguanylate cyclase (GGDEF)-like protein
MSKIQNLKKKILKYNILSIYVILIFFTISSFFIVYFTIYEKYQTDVEIIKKNYIQNQKLLMKNQINNLVNYINVTRKEIKSNEINEIDKLLNFITTQIKNNNSKIIHKKINALFSLFPHLSAKITKNKKIVFTKNFNSKDMIIKNAKLQNYNITIGIKKSIIKNITQKTVIKYIYTIRFGAKNNGYISVAEILNYKGGKNFAKVIALPVKPSMVGKILSDDKKDAKGKLYRKEYLKIANTTGEGFVSYWFYKYSDKTIKPKISYVKLYKPWNWLIFTSVFLDDIDDVLHKKELIFKNEIRNLEILYIILFLIILFVARILIEKENIIIKSIIEEYEDKINEKNEILKQNNIHLRTEVDKKTKELVTRMFTDNLTNLPNREKLLNDLNDNYVAIINIDDFKEINDFFGIEEGDKIIKEFGKFLNSNYPTYKLSGDEFAIIAPTPAQLRKYSTNIINKLKTKKFHILDNDIKINVSIGIGKTLSEADIALKYSKNNKKNIIVYNKKLPILKEFEENLKWKKIINDAIENDNIIPYVQAIIDNNTKHVTKYECLMRLKYEDKIYTPYFFLEIAKKTYQYETLQTIMIEKCFKKFSKFDYKFSINLSTKDLRNKQFLEFLTQNIEKYNVAKQLTIELLEDEDLVKDERINKNILKLHNLGVNIAIDDFGSGYSNFVYLIKNLPINTLKIDGTLVKDILSNEKLYKLLQKIVEIAETFNFETIAEFVETEELYDKLKILNINSSQGYYFSKPFDINDLN